MPILKLNAEINVEMMMNATGSPLMKLTICAPCTTGAIPLMSIPVHLVCLVKRHVVQEQVIRAFLIN